MRKDSTFYLIKHTKIPLKRYRRGLLEKSKRKVRNMLISTNGVLISENEIAIHSPSKICIYRKNDSNKTKSFIKNINKHYPKHSNLTLDFSSVQYISAAGMLLLLSTVDRLRRKAGKPPKVKMPKDEKMISIFNQTGFTEILGKKIKDTKEYSDVSFWNFTSGTEVDGEILSSLVERLIGKVAVNERKRLFGGLQEAIANSVEHAYAHLNRKKISQTGRWWAFGGIKDKQAMMLVCDLGAGIPKTVTLEQNTSWVRRALEIFNGNYTDDGDLIHAATKKGETQTKRSHRGYGLAEIRAFIQSTPDALLAIHSNKGTFRLRTSKSGKNYVPTTSGSKHSINGTIIEWQIPLEKVDDN
ncbi:MAG: hypothetical protein LAT65_05825 [Saccharospirillum sp.]|nr:hypothetical protein [Saccharospirillum sp.]